MSNVAVFKEIFRELSTFSKKVHDLLAFHEHELTRKKKKKKHTREGAPKQPLTSYLLFAAEHRQGIVQQHPELKTTEVGRILGQRWKALSIDERQPYEDRANQLRMDYHAAKHKFEINVKNIASGVDTERATGSASSSSSSSMNSSSSSSSSSKKRSGDSSMDKSKRSKV